MSVSQRRPADDLALGAVIVFREENATLRTSYTVSGQSLAAGCEDGHTCTRIAIRTGAGEICSDKHNGNNKRGRRCLVPFLLQAKADQVNSPFDGYAPLRLRCPLVFKKKSLRIAFNPVSLVTEQLSW